MLSNMVNEEKYEKIPRATRIIWFFGWMFFSCLVLGVWIMLRYNHLTLATLFEIH